ncbi:DOLPP1 protein [Aulographum hederae CBS 113979]|uniref:Dolichyldiphosphatase n=1 Tax=Aulographum hederae CBS 113979 TaxID=1176131 RepID=A0A6G1HAT5_9PEZI|nr:DOLPP1 protein [Aulographum hederae CBS 113979]
MNDPPLASLSLTHVHYNPVDRLSYICAWLALVPQALCVIYVTLIWSTREVEILLMFAGQMACEALNWGLKRWIKEERPRQMNGKGYGMPSSHAQFVTFFSLSLSLFLLLRHNPSSRPPPQTQQQQPYSHNPLPFTHRLAISVLSIVSAGVVATSRIYLNYHTPRQVMVGCFAGAVCAVGWFIVTGLLRRWGVVEWGLELGIARWARMRDLVVEEDLVEGGWRRWEERRRVRLRVRDDGGGKKGR